MPETQALDPAARQALMRNIRDGEFAETDVPAYLALFCATANHDGDIQDEVRGWNRRIHLALSGGREMRPGRGMRAMQHKCPPGWPSQTASSPAAPARPTPPS